MGTNSKGKILMFVDDVYEDLELWYPKLRLEEQGYAVLIAGTEKGRVYKGKNGYPCTSDIAIATVLSEEYDGLVIPGGFAPDKLRRDPGVLSLTKEFWNAGKLVAHICHGGGITISAGIMRGTRCTSTPGIKDDIINSGAEWVDQPVVMYKNMISSRRPSDLPYFCRAMISFLANTEKITTALKN